MACQDKKQGITCGDDGRVFAVALCCGAKGDGSCRWDVEDVLRCAVIRRRRRTLGGERHVTPKVQARRRDDQQNSRSDRHTVSWFGVVRWLAAGHVRLRVKEIDLAMTISTQADALQAGVACLRNKVSWWLARGISHAANNSSPTGARSAAASA